VSPRGTGRPASAAPQEPAWYLSGVNPITVRPAARGDVAAVKAIGEAAWPPTYAFAGQEYIAHGLASWWSEEAVARSMETTRTFVAERGAAVIGMGNIDLRGARPVIWKLYVLPEHHGTGAGRALLARLLAQAPASADGVTLEYTDGNERAARFYRGHGFTELRRDPPERDGWPEQVWMIRPSS
jgi:ribosomal protein S18 acetylase RimI-like enzyme